MNNIAGKSVLVTGASSGIGKCTALYLANKGFTVIASVRKASDAEMLERSGIKNLVPLCPLDMAKEDDISAAAGKIIRMVEGKEIPPLYGLIFIAGGGSVAPIELMNTESFREELEKRLVGPVSILQKLMPLLRISKGRILWIATPGLFPVPWVADIHAPDFAVNYLARTLNLELQPDGIKNILIRCGGIKTPAADRTEVNISGSLSHVPQSRLAIYSDRLDRLEKYLGKFKMKRTEPGIVAEKIGQVLIASHPRTRYQVGYMSGAGVFLENFPQKLTDYIMSRRNI